VFKKLQPSSLFNRRRRCCGIVEVVTCCREWYAYATTHE